MPIFFRAVGTFITASDDGTIRLWNTSTTMLERPAHLRNMFSRDLLHTFFTTASGDPTDEPDPDTPGAYAAMRLQAGGAGGGDASGERSPDHTAAGVRSIALSPDGIDLMSGDRLGNVRVHSLANMEQTSFQMAHDGEVLSIDFATAPGRGGDNTDRSGTASLVATASRDRLIHVFDRADGYSLVDTLADHSSSITAVRFTAGGSGLVSCSADKSILFRSVERLPGATAADGYGNVLDVRLEHNVTVPRGTIYDMDVDATDRYIVTAGQEKRVRIYNLASGKPARSYATASDGLRISLSPGGVYLAVSSGMPST